VSQSVKIADSGQQELHGRQQGADGKRGRIAGPRLEAVATAIILGVNSKFAGDAL